MPNEENLDNLDIIVRDKSGLPAPKAETLTKWTQEQLASDAPELYKAFSKSLMKHLEGYADPKTGALVPPSPKVLELAADVLKLRDPGGISIQQNFGGNTTINNNGTTVTFEELVRRQQNRPSRDDETIIEAEVIDVDPGSKTTDRS